VPKLRNKLLLLFQKPSFTIKINTNQENTKSGDANRREKQVVVHAFAVVWTTGGTGNTILTIPVLTRLRMT
jgi:hypothetical protein